MNMHLPSASFRNLLALLLLSLAASGCARRESEDDAAADAASGEAAQIEEAVPEPPKEVAAVTVRVTLSPAAEQKLKSLGEKVKVEIIYGGDPSDTTSLQPNDLGMIELGKKVLELDGAGSVDLPESEVDRSRLDEIVGQPQILVNTTSARKAAANNLLNCTFYWETLSVAGAKGADIHCKLLDEN